MENEIERLSNKTIGSIPDSADLPGPHGLLCMPIRINIRSCKLNPIMLRHQNSLQT